MGFSLRYERFGPYWCASNNIRADGAALDISLAYRKQFSLIRDNETRVVTKVKYLEPLPLQKLC